MKVLITGGSGLLGKSLVENKFLLSGSDVRSTRFTNLHASGFCDYILDVTNSEQITNIMSTFNPDVVIHTASIGSPDYTEKHQDRVNRINNYGTQMLIQGMPKKSLFVYLSTNAVYSGNNPPYNEKSQRNPINQYGRIKKRTEDLVMEECPYWIIVRPFLMYGWPMKCGRENWFTTILNKLNSGKEINLVNDVMWHPTLVKDVATFIWTILKDCKTNVNQSYNVCSDDKMSLYDFGIKVAKRWHGKKLNLITSVPSDYFNAIAPRPNDTSFDTTKVKNMGFEFKNVEEGISSLEW